jgi:hypothetical protein
VYNYKLHITLRITTIIIVACLLLPTGIKISHVFSHHEHEVCIGENQSHFHEIDMDCEFYKFNLNNNFYFKVVDYSIDFKIKTQTVNVKNYVYLKDHQYLSTYLRGPPYLM